jgi:Protein of unknown function (DUF1355).
MIDALTVEPILPTWMLAAAAAVALFLLTLALLRGGRGAWLRAASFAALFAALLDPRLVREERANRPDVAMVVVDDSPSQRAPGRQALTDQALAHLQAQLSRFENVETRIVRAGGASGDGETRLFDAIERALPEDSAARLGGVFIITDGQVHDVPETPPKWLGAPVHALLSGAPDEFDRRLTVVEAPAYGIVGATVDVRVRLDDLGRAPAGLSTEPVPLRMRINGDPQPPVMVAPGEPATVQLPLKHAGPAVLELAVDPAPGEISPVNNSAAVVVNGVRDRLRVLLVSGQPHPGERVWRNLLKSDPSVDLVHFTILRPPEKDDATPLKELSLIVFPVQELFEQKLPDFDLVVFDRYALRGVLPFPYYDRIAAYVRGGGALLLAAGPEFAGERSVAHTSLGEILPVIPNGRIREQSFRPQITDVGRRHPIASELPGETPAGDDSGEAPAASPVWGPWFRAVEADARGGQVLLQGPGQNPLLVVDRVDEGRIAVLLSDQIWLWARGYDGGGPHAELLRRLAHWLMKEPELEEERLTASVASGRLSILRRSVTPGDREITVTSPSGAESRLMLVDGADGIARGDLPVDEQGLWRVSDGERTALAAVGRINPPELRDLRATSDLLAPLATATNGGVVWLAEGMPDVRRVEEGDTGAGRNWVGVVRNHAYTVTGIRQISLLPGFLVLALMLSALATAWWREGR